MGFRTLYKCSKAQYFFHKISNLPHKLKKENKKEIGVKLIWIVQLVVKKQ